MNRRELLTYLGIFPATYLASRLPALTLPAAKSTSPTPSSGILSGFKDLDAFTGGFYPGELTVLAGRPSMGKTACALNIVRNTAMVQKRRIAYFSIEMGREQIMARLLALESGLRLSDIRVGKIESTDWSRLIKAATDLSNSQISIDDDYAICPTDLFEKCRKLKEQGGLDLVVVDYLQLMRLRRKATSRRAEVAEISAALKSIAIRLDVPVLALAQLNRGVEFRTDRRPVLSDLRESSAIEHQADKVILLYRDSYYDRTSRNKQTEMIVAKNRTGRTGTANVAWEPNVPLVQEVRT